jgi:1-acyl-sn-glycerol-3-phosphate acyltransferase
MVRGEEGIGQRVSLIVFAEGSRTLDRLVGCIQPGVFHMAQQFGTPIVPMSIVSSFEFNRKGDWMLLPSKIDVTCTTLSRRPCSKRADVDSLRERVHQIISAPLMPTT